MSDGSLSQDEIDALLQGTDAIEMDTGAGPASSPLSDAERSSFQEMLRGVTESQSSNLSILTGKTVAIGDPAVKVRSAAELTSGQPDDVVDVRVSDPMMLKIGDRRKFVCRPGVVGNKIAVQVLKKLEDIEQAEFEELVADEGEEA